MNRTMCVWPPFTCLMSLTRVISLSGSTYCFRDSCESKLSNIGIT